MFSFNKKDSAAVSLRSLGSLDLIQKLQAMKPLLVSVKKNAKLVKNSKPVKFLRVMSAIIIPCTFYYNPIFLLSVTLLPVHHMLHGLPRSIQQKILAEHGYVHIKCMLKSKVPCHMRSYKKVLCIPQRTV